MRTPALPLYGRDDELARLRDLIDHVPERGGALVLRGEAGIGKSALISQAAVRARERGLTVRTATGVQSEARFAFAGLHQLLLPFLNALDRLPAPQRRALEMAFGMRDAPDDRAPDVFLIALGALGVITEVVDTAPLLLAVDDAQWLDQPSCEVLGFIGRRLDVEPVIVLLGVREGVGGSADVIGLPELRVPPLAGAAADALLSSHAEHLPADLRARLLREAAGNPLALIELPKAFAGQDGKRPSPQNPLPLTARLEEVFAARLSDFPPGTRTLVLLASLDDSGETSDLLRAAELILEHSLGAEAFHPAVAGGLGVAESGRFRFRHPLMRSAVQQAVTAAERRRGHAALAEILAGRPDRSIWHRAAAADRTDETVAADLAALARRAELRGGGDVAVSALDLAASLSDQPRQGQRRIQAAWLAFQLGRREDSLRLARQAQQLPLAAYERTLVAYLLELLGGSWSGPDSIRSFLAVAEDLAAAGDKARALRMIGMVSLRLYFANPDDETRRRAVAVAGQVTASRDDPFFLEILAYADPVGQGCEIIGRLAALSPASMTDPDELMAAGGAASAAWADDLAVPFLREASEASRAAGQLASLTNALALEAWAYLRRGDLRAVAPAAAEGVRMATETRQPRYLAVAKTALAIVAGERGDPAAADLVAEAEAVLLPMGAGPMLSLVELARGRIALAGERFAEACDHFARVFDPGDFVHHPFICGWVLADIVEAAVYAERDPGEVRGIVAEWEKIAAVTGAGHLRVQLGYARALLADEADAPRRFAAALAGTHDWPYYRARTQLAYGTWLRRRRHNAESRSPLREAADTFTALGSMRFADRAHRELRASGETVRKRQPEAWDELTPQELQIAQLAADGLTNREIGERLYISHRTVGTHLYQLFPKLGVTSRTELRAVLQPS
ncbi:helix-turn-helix transcriptional regulator [Trebonia kvetii]|uniref:Helix-turn-helix transcriptional regulator n=1 Tax=Trebonia kvetii TaxID=2480626 RepID=A0A6P2C6F3_9ACTN|nr:LuxR family transcriptional regulator [Trebonia kvetii]TVZ06085.1 helix-turn-helix transcriptional regulator [Trebonia kvetii]